MTNLPACQALRARLVKGEKVKTGELRGVLNDEHWQDYHYNRSLARSMRTAGKAVRSKLASYFKLLSLADLKYGQSEKLSTTKSMRELKRVLSGRPAKLTVDGSERLRGGEAYYELALERLEELIGQDASLVGYIDRTWDWGDEGGMIAPDHDSMPRLSSTFIPQSVADSMLTTVEKAIADANVEQDAGEVDTTALSMSRLKMLTKLMRR